MKSLRPLLLVLAGVLIAVSLFSFKNNKQGSECLIIRAYSGNIKVLFNGNIIDEAKYNETEVEMSKVINKYTLEGWTIKTSYFAPTNQRVVIYLERFKQ